MSSIKKAEQFNDLRSRLQGVNSLLNEITADMNLTVEIVTGYDASGISAIMWDWENKKHVKSFYSFSKCKVVISEQD